MWKNFSTKFNNIKFNFLNAQTVIISMGILYFLVNEGNFDQYFHLVNNRVINFYLLISIGCLIAHIMVVFLRNSTFKNFGKITIRGFEKIEILGFGSFGRVTKYRCKKYRELYAIKQVWIKEPHYKDKLLEECRILTMLDSKYVVDLWNFWIEGEFLYMQMELCLVNLEQILRERFNTFNRIPRTPMSNYEFRVFHRISRELIGKGISLFVFYLINAKIVCPVPFSRGYFANIFVQGAITKILHSPTFSHSLVIRHLIFALQHKTRKNLFLYLIIECLNHLHTFKPGPIMHRDLKPENILFANGNYGRIIKLGDFGFAKIHSHSSNNTDVGTENYVDPLVTTGYYNYKVDIYSLGVILRRIFVDQDTENKYVKFEMYE